MYNFSRDSEYLIITALQCYEQFITGGKSYKYMNDEQKKEYSKIAELYKYFKWDDLTNSFEK